MTTDFWIIKVACVEHIVLCLILMASKKCSLIWVVLFLSLLSFSAKAIARNLAGASEFNAVSDETGPSRRLLGGEQHPPCERGRVTYDVSQGGRREPSRDNPRCHNYL
ncbi:RALF protein [Spatholobus suberectus]|nr:RALF protein [Spatholobus suberectus]